MMLFVVVWFDGVCPTQARLLSYNLLTALPAAIFDDLLSLTLL